MAFEAYQHACSIVVGDGMAVALEQPNIYMKTEQHPNLARVVTRAKIPVEIMAEKGTESLDFYDPQQESSSMTPKTNVTSRENAGIEINLKIGSISNVSVDVIVNSTSKNLQLNNGSISKLILNAAGPEIQNECNQKYPRGISTSEIAVTKGYNLNCKNVFHLVLPPWDVNSPDSILANLTQIITTCLEKAERIEARNLAFPILGAGTLRYPIEKLPGIMYEAVKNYSDLNSSQIKDVYFVVYSQDTEIVKVG
ncbi:Hypothetical predicted protein [Octopus vulgaris]|uniref:Macro domain-containing protein n=1 Tax=Octopus vulgaris TaxID=6645 RepID=A0AA36EVF8_OCTVU|nr:Hypothetical predicted protein [Octopus vulgaris]